MTKRVLIAVVAFNFSFFLFYNRIDANVLNGQSLAPVIKAIITSIMRRKIPVDTIMVNDARP